MSAAPKFSRIALTAVAAMACLFINDNWSSTKQSSLTSQAEARVGRPATPGSVAGVARRTTRRGAVVGGAAVGAGAYYGTYGTGGYYGNGCRQIRNSYGQLVTVCR